MVKSLGGCIVQVWFEAERDPDFPRARFAVIETELPDFLTFCQMVESDQLIGGAILWPRRGADGEQVVWDRQPCVFRGAAVLRAQLPRWRFIEGAR